MRPIGRIEEILEGYKLLKTAVLKVCISRVAHSLRVNIRFENVANCRVTDCRGLFETGFQAAAQCSVFLEG